MRVVLVCLVLLGACAKKDDYPVGGGGGGGPGMTGGGDDAAMDGNTDGASTISGRVCLTKDLRVENACSDTTAGGFTVDLGTETTMTGPDGRFTINLPGDSDLTWRVTGGAIVTSIKAFTLDYTIVAITTTDYGTLGAIVDPGNGSMIVYLVRGGMPLADATAAVSPNGGAFAPFYDGATATGWQQTKTEKNGVVWLPDAAAGAQTMTVTPALGPQRTAVIPVEAGAIRFTTLDVPSQ